MARKQRSVEEIIGKLREAEVALAQGESVALAQGESVALAQGESVALAQGESVALACRRIGVSDQTFYRWRQEYGGLRIDQARRLREMEAENARLRRAVADLTVDNQILKEAARGNF